MSRRSDDPDSTNRRTCSVVKAFLESRLAEQATIDWALNLHASKAAERTAIKELLNGLPRVKLHEPWASAWCLIEESWSKSAPGGAGFTVDDAKERLEGGDRSGALIAAMVDLVAPRLKVVALDDLHRASINKQRNPNKVEHLLSARLTSGKLVDLNVLRLADLSDVAKDGPFLKSLGNALDRAVQHGLDIARRLGWDGTRFWLVGDLYRAYYTQPSGWDGETDEPDTDHVGIAPSVKLLHAVVARLAELQIGEAKPFVHRWREDASPVFIRLWAAMARDHRFASAEAVASFLIASDDREFWKLHLFPEIAELRAVRFGDLDPPSQTRIAARVQKGPPRKYWPRGLDAEKVSRARQYWAARELRRIEMAGGGLPPPAQKWLDDRRSLIAELEPMRIDTHFPESSAACFVPPDPDPRFDDLHGEERLRTLEAALATIRIAFDNDPAQRADDWINQEGSAEKLVGDFESTGNGGDDFPRVWDRFGRSFTRRQPSDQTGPRASAETNRVLVLLHRLSPRTLEGAIDGVSKWFYFCAKQAREEARKLPLLLPVWLRLWPIAAEATNRMPEIVVEPRITAVRDETADDYDPAGFDALNTPAGRLTGVFLAACPELRSGSGAFREGSVERKMRDMLVSAEGRSRLTALYRMILDLPYFLAADEGWAKEHLIEPLRKDDDDALALWPAVASRTRFDKILRHIGGEAANRATDRRLSRRVRRSLTESLVIESLHAFREDRKPALPNERITQMLRQVEDEVRALGADAVQLFVRQLSMKASGNDGEARPELALAAELFRKAAKPFLGKVWPQERSLATPGVSAAFADLPATSGDAFAEAVDAIERFLKPFRCWSMFSFGLYGEKGDVKNLSLVNDERKAQALLRLLDLTVGEAEDAVIPNDLASALDQIRSVAPALADSQQFRRLSTATRR